MTTHTTEDRLRDALGAAARTVPTGAAGPGLPIAGRSAAQSTGRSRRWPVVALAAAAVSALAIVVPAVLLPRSEPAQQYSPPPTQLPPVVAPPYLLTSDEAGQRVTMYDSATGQPRTTLRVAGGRRVTAIAAAPDQQTFYLGVVGPGCDSGVARLVLGPDSKAGTVAPGPAWMFSGLYVSQLAVSPDGRRLAVSTARAEDKGCPVPDERPLVVLDLSSGDRQTWQGLRWGAPTEVSWAPDNRNLAFLWDSDRAEPNGRGSGQLRVLDTAAPGDDLLASMPVTDGEQLGIPGHPVGLLRNLAVTADGRFAQAVFWANEPAGEQDPQALIRISLSTGEIQVLDNQLQSKEIGYLVADASRRHIFAVGYEKLGRYRDGRATWFTTTSSPVWLLAW